jgi:hypothetical protein
MMPEPPPEPEKPTSASQLLIGRICTTLLLGIVVAALFGDIFLWAILGTKFIQSARFHKMEPQFQGLGVILMFLFMAQAKKDWKQGKPHLVLLGFAALIATGLPFAPLCTTLLFVATIKGVVPFSSPSVLFLVFLLVLSAFCKWKAFVNFWRLIRAIYEPQEARRIVISN